MNLSTLTAPCEAPSIGRRAAITHCSAADEHVASGAKMEVETRVSIATTGQELRAGLNEVLDRLEMLAATKLTSRQRRCARRARISIDSLLSLVDELLADEASPLVRGEESELAACPFHLESLLDRCLGDARLCTLLLQKFAARAADQMTAIQRAARAGNGAELVLHAHTLKEVAANISADDLRANAAELERLARAGELEKTGAPIERIRAEIARSLRAMPVVLTQISRHWND
jgi:HPt (histidine-containing phosphotransfer) domain-containing protein